MRIMFVVPALRGGGAEFVARTWMGALVERGHHVVTVLTAGDVDPAYAPAGVEFHSLKGRGGQVAKVRAIAKAMQREKPDVVLALQAHPNLLALIASRLISRQDRPAVLISERNLVSLGLRSASLSHRVKIRIAKLVYPWADHVVAISHPVAAELVAGFGVLSERCTVIPNPATAKTSRAAAADGMRQPSDTISIVLPSRLVSQKRPELAVATAAELARRGVSVRVVSFGDGPLKASVELAARRAGVDIEFKGWVEDWFTQFPADAVVLLPSDREGFGNVLVEAAAAGFPSVALSAALGVADAIVPGITGELAVSDRPSDIADAVQRASALTMTDTSRWLHRFSPENSVSLLEALLDRTRRDVSG